MEKQLLELVLTARAGKCQSKYQRLMAQYRTDRFTSNLATGEEGESITNFAAEGLNKAAESSSGPAEQSSGNSSLASDEEKRQLSRSHQQRSSKVKRLRDKAVAAATATTAANDRALEAFIAACNRNKQFFKKRTKQIEQIGTRTRLEALSINSRTLRF
ncbi:uncharacterized protein PITG_09869 [Phytophthora infestans T30-4]|uniref:Uncharacterized protein n=1 Tax=Phytophthora infestans (strain T30-4) TaxID=403677 RepID=D0NER8_PHYIT|nr:uncharacterized protein PITG_09869 [Phytophthora infestans T30-4]EEY56350.1 conserved hypothetical protein [Phytophthora infestans T30-4]|eukprot:XP_002902424.1 conserved hypothetical protein [Phytophthora infestans T30-4]